MSQSLLDLIATQDDEEIVEEAPAPAPEPVPEKQRSRARTDQRALWYIACPSCKKKLSGADEPDLQVCVAIPLMSSSYVLPSH